MTKHRKGLYPIKPFDKETARKTVRLIEELQNDFLDSGDTRFLFASDELYLKAGLPLPGYESYEDFPQIENGVGLVAKFDREFHNALSAMEKTKGEIAVVTGEASYPFMEKWAKELEPYGILCKVYGIKNEFFGGGVDVSGLITGSDIVSSLKDKKINSDVLLPACMFRDQEDVFLDDMTIQETAHILGMHFVKTPVNGHDFVRMVFERSTSA